MSIAIYTLTSPLHDEKTVDEVSEAFLQSLEMEYEFKGMDYSDYGSHSLDLIFVRTGGTEGIFKPMLPALREKTSKPFLLLTSGKSNSLAASLEILSYLKGQGLEGEILHGPGTSKRIASLMKVEEARRSLAGLRVGVIGAPSDWLIASEIDRTAVKSKTGIEILDIPIERIIEGHKDCSDISIYESAATSEKVKDALPGAMGIYRSIKRIAQEDRLDALTVRCFDLLPTLGNTGCIALARLNAEGITSGCEGDVPTLISMMIARAVSGVSGFQANPARIDASTGELLLAHCTIPFDMVDRFELDTHFESGIGVGIRGWMRNGPVTIFKISGDLSRSYCAEGTLVRSQGESNLCRTQQIIFLDEPSKASYFLTEPIGNHHVVIPGKWAKTLEAMVSAWR